MPQQNIGNINYSLNKNDFYKIIIGGLAFFIPFYYILTLLSSLFLINIRFMKYYFSNRNSKYSTNTNIKHYFQSITENSPFNILNIKYNTKGNDKYIGLSDSSYIILIISYVITLLILLQGIIKSLLYSIYSSIIQVNNNNNPYNNANTISKTNISPYSSSLSNYTSIIFLAFVFLVPFSLSFIIKRFNYDIYNIKHTKWLEYLILFILFFPIISIIIFYSAFINKLSILPNLKHYLDSHDFSFVDFISDNFNLRIYSIIPFLFIIFIYCYYTMIHADFNYSFRRSLIIYLILFLIIFIIIPFVIFFFSINLLFNNKHINEKINNINTDETDIIENIKHNGISSLYDLLVKYNYPCFPK